MTTILYGIPNCDTVKKARVWLDQHGVAHHFHDFRKAGLDAATVRTWLGQVAWETLLNRKGTTWRGLAETRKAAVIDADSALALILEAPTVVKRPVLHTPDSIHVGYTDALYQQIFGQQK